MISQLLRTFYDTELNSEGEGPSRGLLRDYEFSDGPSFQALVAVVLSSSPLDWLCPNTVSGVMRFA